jgi:catechol 2,3-dioxygenase-like lactoylglutathione lyase family enzyme
MAAVSGLGHVGLYVKDMAKMIDFYTNVLGMTLTDRADDDWIVFLSADPEREHHELALARSDQRTDAQQVSFIVDTLPALKELHGKVLAAGCTFDRTVNHGIAFGCYFHDPEDNQVEIYWRTGIDYPQPFGDPIDMTASDQSLLAALDALPPREGTGPHYYGTDVGKRKQVARA